MGFWRQVVTRAKLAVTRPALGSEARRAIASYRENYPGPWQEGERRAHARFGEYLSQGLRIPGGPSEVAEVAAMEANSLIPGTMVQLMAQGASLDEIDHDAIQAMCLGFQMKLADLFLEELTRYTR